MAPTAAANTRVCWNSAGTRPDIVHARGRREDIADKQRKLGLAFGYRLGHLRGRRLRLDLGFHLLADAETLEHAQEMLAVDAFREDGDGFCLKQRLLERLGRTDVGLRRAGSHGGTEPHAGDRRASAGREQSLPGGIVHHVGDENGNIEGLASLDLLDQTRGRSILE